MSVDERIRQRVHQRFEELIGPEEADAVVEALFRVPWQDIATKADVRDLGVELRGEIAELRGEIAELRGELRGEIGGLRGEIGGLRGELRGEIGGLRAEMYKAISAQTRWFVASNTALVGIALAAAKLLF